MPCSLTSATHREQLALIDPISNKSPLEDMDKVVASQFCVVKPNDALRRLLDCARSEARTADDLSG